MTLAPSRPDVPADATDDAAELLIKEARRNGHRRRLRTGIPLLAALVAMVVLVTLAVGGAPIRATPPYNSNAVPNAAPAIPVKNGLIAFLTWNGRLGFVNPDGSGLRYATGYPCPSPTSCDRTETGDIAWSPNGSQLAYLVALGSSRATREYTLYLVSADGRLRRLTPCGQCSDVSWSPDGSQIAVGRDISGPEGGASVWVVNAKTGAMRQITDCQSEPDCPTAGYSFGVDPQWLPNGKILFSRIGKNGVGSSTYVVRPNGSDLTQLKGYKFSVWSPNGNEVAVYAGGLGGFDITNADGKVLTHVAVGYPTAWSPDGTKLLYAAQTRRLRTPGAGVWTINADLSDRRLLYTNPPVGASSSGQYKPMWSPDGKQIIWTAWQGTYVINADGSDLHRIATGTAMLAWQPIP